MQLDHIFRKCIGGYKLNKSQEKINPLIYMNDMKLSAKKEKELKTLIKTVRIYGRVMGMEFGIEKSGHTNKEKQEMTQDGRDGTTK